MTKYLLSQDGVIHRLPTGAWDPRRQ